MMRGNGLCLCAATTFTGRGLALCGDAGGAVCGGLLLCAQDRRSERQRTRKLFVTASVAMNLSVLGFFKYFHSFADSAIGMAAKFGTHLDEPTIDIILPVGVAFLHLSC